MISPPVSPPVTSPVSSPYAVFRAEDWPSLFLPVSAAPAQGRPQVSVPCPVLVLIQGELFEFLLPA